MGGSQRMRGYYQGRYTDNDMITFQVELRQRIWRRIGCTVWGGAGNVFNSLDRFDWSETLPNYGVGLRWELKKTGQCAARLRLRQENQRIPAEPERSFLG